MTHPDRPADPAGAPARQAWSSARVDTQRLRADVDALARIGRAPDGGIHRVAFSAPDMEARRWLAGRMQAAGLATRIDGAGNVIGRLGPAGTPAVAIGSHLDTVPGGGHLDGALGVCVGLECLRRIAELGAPHGEVAFECVGFSDEEGRFGGMLGSQAMAGQLTPESILAAQDAAGVRLVDAMAAVGLDAMEALKAQPPPGHIRAFLELHIEQGPVLDRLGVSLGLVDAIAGLLRWHARLLGTPNHAGTTPMDMRADAFGGAAEAALAVPRILEEYGTGRSVATIGRVELVPGAANVVPGRADFTLDVRDTDPTVLEQLGDAFRRAFAAIARRRGLMFEFDVVSEIPPTRCDPAVMSCVRRASEALGVEPHVMASGAAHDAQTLAGVAPAGMLFVPSKAGRSHSAAEWTDWHDIEIGANVALQALYRLAA